MEYKSSVRSGFLGVIDTAIDYFDPKKNQINLYRKGSISVAEEAIKQEALKLRQEVKSLRDQYKQTQDNYYKLEFNYNQLKNINNHYKSEQQSYQSRIFNMKQLIREKDAELEQVYQLYPQSSDTSKRNDNSIEQSELFSDVLDQSIISLNLSQYPENKQQTELEQELQLADENHEVALAQLDKLSGMLNAKQQQINELMKHVDREVAEKKKLLQQNKALFEEKAKLFIRKPLLLDKTDTDKSFRIRKIGSNTPMGRPTTATTTSQTRFQLGNQSRPQTGMGQRRNQVIKDRPTTALIRRKQ